MTLGEKIKKYRHLRNMTQKELGDIVGITDAAIRNYELNNRTPIEKIFKKITKALEVDYSALSNNDISSFEDFMHVLFEFEDKYGLSIVKKECTTSLVFDDNNKEIATLISYLNIWQDKRNSINIDEEDVSDETIREYQLWKGKFKSNVEEYYSKDNNKERGVL